MYPAAKAASDGQPLDGSKHNYTLTFAAGKYPPVNAFWSVTMDDGKTQLLIQNPINRYLINSPMLPALQKNADGSLTIYIKTMPRQRTRSQTGYPRPTDQFFYLVMRLYWPKRPRRQFFLQVMALGSRQRFRRGLPPLQNRCKTCRRLFGAAKCRNEKHRVRLDLALKLTGSVLARVIPITHVCDN